MEILNQKDEFNLGGDEADTLAKVVGGVGAGYVLNNVAGNPLRKKWNSTKTKNSMPNDSSNPNSDIRNTQGDKSIKNQSSHNKSFSSSDIDDYYNEEERKSQSKIDRMDGKNDRDNAKIVSAEDDIKDLKTARSTTYDEKEKKKIDKRIADTKHRILDTHDRIDERNELIANEEEKLSNING